MTPIRRGTARRLGLRPPLPHQPTPWLMALTVAEARAAAGFPMPALGKHLTIPRSMLGPTSCQACNETYPDPCIWHTPNR